MTKQERLEKEKERYRSLEAFDTGLLANGIRFLAGVDEVGRGPLAGPVTCACVVLPADSGLLGVDDSKKLTDRRRRILSERILETALAYGFGEQPPEVIDRINILEATKAAMREAVREADEMLRARTGQSLDLVVIDAVHVEGLGFPQRAVVRGDSTSLSVAAASVIAKVHRDDEMIALAEKFPGYGFEKNKGYGTRAHYEGLNRQGPSPVHRRTFLRSRGSYPRTSSD